MIAYAGLLLMYIAILSYGSWTLTGVTEEKNNRVVEVLLATLRPWQLLGGKVLGIGILAIGQFVLTIGFAFALVNLTDVLDIPPASARRPALPGLWFILGFAVYSVSYAAAGSLASRPEDAQSAAFPMTMLAVAGFFVSINSLDDPTSMLARVTSFIPFTAPFVVPIRRSLDGIGTGRTYRSRDRGDPVDRSARSSVRPHLHRRASEVWQTGEAQGSMAGGAAVTGSRIEVERRQRTGLIWLNRPEKRNALSADMWAALPTAAASLSADPEIRVIVVAARGPAFSVGIDLEMLGALAPEGESEASRRMAMYQRITELQTIFHQPGRLSQTGHRGNPGVLPGSGNRSDHRLRHPAGLLGRQLRCTRDGDGPGRRRRHAAAPAGDRRTGPCGRPGLFRVVISTLPVPSASAW